MCQSNKGWYSRFYTLAVESLLQYIIQIKAKYYQNIRSWYEMNGLPVAQVHIMYWEMLKAPKNLSMNINLVFSNRTL